MDTNLPRAVTGVSSPSAGFGTRYAVSLAFGLGAAAVAVAVAVAATPVLVVLEPHPGYDSRESRVAPQRVQERLEEILRDVEVFLVDAPVEPVDTLSDVPQPGVPHRDGIGRDQLRDRPPFEVVDNVQRGWAIAGRSVRERDRRGGLRIKGSEVDRALERRDGFGVAVLLNLDESESHVRARIVRVEVENLADAGGCLVVPVHEVWNPTPLDADLPRDRIQLV